MLKRTLTTLLAAALAVSALASCNSGSGSSTASESTSETSSSAASTASSEESSASVSSAESSETASAGVTIPYPSNMQERGYTEPLTLESEPERVVVMTKSPVLALYELGVEMIAIPEAGSSTVWPEDLDAATEKLNTTMNSNFDIETVIALEPDLVVMGYTSEETYGQALDDADIPVYYVDAGHTVSYESTKSQTEALVEAFGEGTGAGEAMLARFDELEARLDSVKDQYADMKVMVLQSSPPTHYIQTSEGTLASMAAMMGFGNVYENDAASMAELDREAALSYDPDLVLAVGGSATAEEHQAVMEDDFANNPDYWNSIPAIAGGDILYFPASFIASNGIAIIDNINSLIDMVEAHFAE